MKYFHKLYPNLYIENIELKIQIYTRYKKTPIASLLAVVYGFFHDSKAQRPFYPIGFEVL